MSLNTDLVGRSFGPRPFIYTHDEVILYALGIGAGESEPDFLYEKDLKVFPTFAVLPVMPIVLEDFVPRLGLNLPQVLHSGHQVVLHRPIPPAATMYTTAVCESVYDKADKGALLNFRFQTHDASGRLVFENHAIFIDRSAGHFGGDRGPGMAPLPSPGNKKPDFSVSSAVPRHQAALYRLSGDKNPIHIDPAFAAQGGFDRPILHGLCTAGYACRAVVHSLCGGDPTRLSLFALQFAGVVYPGDTLTTQGWKRKDGGCMIRTVNQAGKAVLDHGVAVVS